MPTTFGAAVGDTPRLTTASTRSGRTSFHRLPWLSPSNVTVPIITQASGTVPATGSSRGSPVNGGRSPTTRSRVSKTDSREKRLK